MYSAETILVYIHTYIQSYILQSIYWFTVYKIVMLLTLNSNNESKFFILSLI